MGGGISAVGQKLKDTFTTLFKGGKAVANWLGGRGTGSPSQDDWGTDGAPGTSGLGIEYEGTDNTMVSVAEGGLISGGFGEKRNPGIFQSPQGSKRANLKTV